MKNKGFSLIEMLAVITLLGLLAILVAVPVNKIVSKSRKQLNDRQKTQIELAAQNWASDNPYQLPPFTENKKEIQITIEQLNDAGYFENEIVSLIDKKVLKLCSYVKITLVENADNNQNVYNYKFNEEESCDEGN